jgi:hypothetical protein
MPCTLPLTQPSPSASFPPRTELSAEEETKVKFLIDFFSHPELRLPTKLKDWKSGHTKSSKLESMPDFSKIPAEGTAPLSDNEKCFLSREREPFSLLDGAFAYLKKRSAMQSSSDA